MKQGETEWAPTICAGAHSQQEVDVTIISDALRGCQEWSYKGPQFKAVGRPLWSQPITLVRAEPFGMARFLWNSPGSCWGDRSGVSESWKKRGFLVWKGKLQLVQFFLWHKYCLEISMSFLLKALRWDWNNFTDQREWWRTEIKT